MRKIRDLQERVPKLPIERSDLFVKISDPLGDTLHLTQRTFRRLASFLETRDLLGNQFRRALSSSTCPLRSLRRLSRPASEEMSMERPRLLSPSSRRSGASRRSSDIEHRLSGPLPASRKMVTIQRLRKSTRRPSPSSAPAVRDPPLQAGDFNLDGLGIRVAVADFAVPAQRFVEFSLFLRHAAS